MPASTVILFPQPSQLILGKDFGNKIPVPLAAYSQQWQQLAMLPLQPTSSNRSSLASACVTADSLPKPPHNASP